MNLAEVSTGFRHTGVCLGDEAGTKVSGNLSQAFELQMKSILSHPRVAHSHQLKGLLGGGWEDGSTLFSLFMSELLS